MRSQTVRRVLGYSLLSLAEDHFHALNLLGCDQNTRRDELWATVITASDDIFLSGQSVFCIMHWENVVKRYRQSHHSVLWTKLVDLLIIAVAISGLRLLISKYQVDQ